MTKSAKSDLQTKTTPKQPQALKGHIYTMAAAFAGVIFGVLGSMGFVGNYLDSQFAAQTAALDKRIVATAPAAAVTPGACYGTSTAEATPTVATAKAGSSEAHTAMTPGGKGADTTPPPTHYTPHAPAPFVSQLVNGTISNTGPGSSAVISATNSVDYEVTNNNNVSVSNNNSQSSSSGSASSSSNTTAGSTMSGASDNSNSTSTVLHINN